MKRLISLLTSALLISLFSSTSFADDRNKNIDKLSSFKSTGATAGIVVPQEGKYMDNIKKNILPKIKMPPGFKISLFARVPDARHMAVARNKTTVWIGTRKDKELQATDRDIDDIADTVEQFSPAVNFDIPNGVCFSTDGHLYVAERNRVLWFPAAEFFMES